MAWVSSGGKACFSTGVDGDMLLQVVPQTPGDKYILKFTISGMTQGKLRVDNYEETLEFTEDGLYTVLCTPENTTLVFIATIDNDNDLFIGCIDNIELYTLATFTPSISQCVNLMEDQSCLLLVEASDSGNNLNFDWTDLTLSMRIKAKYAKVAYKTQREPYINTEGEENILYFNTYRSRFLQVDAAPTWTHDFLVLCMGVNNLTINSDDYVIDEEEYPEIKWNRSFKEGTVELKIREKVNKLNKTNC